MISSSSRKFVVISVGCLLLFGYSAKHIVPVARTPVETKVETGIRQVGLPEAEGVIKFRSYPLRRYKGRVDTDFSLSLHKSGVNRYLGASFRKIFAWHIDFDRDLRRGDRWRFVVREKLLGGEHLGWEDIIAAEYVHNRRRYRAVRYEVEGKKALYYFLNGESVARIFLPRPVKLGRVTSGFSRRRFHPVLKMMKPHMGVDYSASLGTEVLSIGDGTVVKAGYNNHNGYYIKIRHDAVYHSAYCHLQGFSVGLRRGKAVKQGEVIGYVGSSGRATGPHLHFSFYKHGKYIDPLGKKIPARMSVPARYRHAFQKTARLSFAKLPSWHAPEVL